MTAAAPITTILTTAIMIVIVSTRFHPLLFLTILFMLTFRNTSVYPFSTKTQFRICRKNNAKEQDNQKH